MQDENRRISIGLIALLLFVILFPINVASEEINSCCESDDFDLFLIDEADQGMLTPFDDDLTEEKSKIITPSIAGEIQIGKWGILWSDEASYPSSSWNFRIPYEIVDASGVTTNTTLRVKIGDSNFESDPQLPGAFLQGSGDLQISVDIQNGEISEGDRIEVTLSVQGLVFSNPGGDSGIKFLWGSTENNAALSLRFPLLEMEMREANVKGGLVFFPVFLKSGFGDKMWTSSEGTFMVKNTEVTQSPITTINEEGIIVTFVWEIPDGEESGIFRTDFEFSPQSGLILRVDKNHDITIGVDSGDSSWYPDEEPSRIGDSELDIIIDSEYNSGDITRDISIRFDGAMSQWMRWGLDNIGNSSLASNSWWRNLNSYSDSIASSDKQNGKVDDSEIYALRNHLTGSKSDLRSFLASGLLIESESIFGKNPVDLGPIEIGLDFGSSRAFNSERISITISTSSDVEKNSRELLIKDFIKVGGYEYWTKVDLSLEVKTGMLSGFGGVFSESEDISYSHRRWVILEVLKIQEEDIEKDDNFRIEFSTSNSLVYSPLVSSMISVFFLCAAIAIAIGLTRKRVRFPSMIMVGVLGVLTVVVYWFGLPMQIVLGVVASSILLVFPVSLISPTNGSWDDSGISKKQVGRVKCPSCKMKNPIYSEIRPLRIDCSGCGNTLRLE